MDFNQISARRETRIKLIGGELIYRERGGDWASMAAAVTETKRRAFDLREPFAAFEEVWYEQNEMIFAEEGIPHWAALSPRYAKVKAHDFPDQGILRATDRLYESLTSRTHDTVFKVTQRTIKLGTAVPYSDSLQGGAGTMPAREHNILLDETFNGLVETVGQYVTFPMNEAFGGPAT